MSDSGKSPWRHNMVPGATPRGATRSPPKQKSKMMPARDGSDAYFASMAYEPNPTPADWMFDPTKLPKKPPGRS